MPSASAQSIPVSITSWPCSGGVTYFDWVLPTASTLRYSFSTAWQRQSNGSHDSKVCYTSTITWITFVTDAPHTPECAQHLHCLTSLCTHLRILLAEDKHEGPTTQLEYLGILLDSASLEARLRHDKLRNIKSTNPLWESRVSCTKQELLSLIGTLSFAAKAVPAGLTFLRHAIDLSRPYSAFGMLSHWMTALS